MAEETLAYLGLGTNLGDRHANLVAGLRLLLGLDSDRNRENLSPSPAGLAAAAASGVAHAPGTGLTLVAVSSIYETAPWGLTEQPPFLNAVCAVRTTLSPRALLRRCLDVEQALGRIRVVRWGPRTLDLDLLLYGRERIAEPDLTVPHPRLTERAFVLVPLLEVGPHLTLPDGTPLDRFRSQVDHQGIAAWRPAAAFWQDVINGAAAPHGGNGASGGGEGPDAAGP